MEAYLTWLNNRSLESKDKYNNVIKETKEIKTKTFDTDKLENLY